MQLFIILLIWTIFLVNYGKSTIVTLENTPSVLPWLNEGRKFKRNVDLEIFKDVASARQNHINNEAIVYVCGDEERRGIECYCVNREITCWKGLKDANVKPIDEYYGIEDVFLTEMNFTVLKKDQIFPGNENSIKKLSFHDLQIELQAFDKFTSLIHLTISKNLLKHIDENVLTEKVGSTLLTLDLSLNNLSFHDFSMFKYLFNLQELNLGGNKQKSGKIEIQFPEDLSNLKILHLGSCDLNNFGDDIFQNLEQLETLRLHYNNFVTVPSAISKLTNLKILHFDGNHFESFGKSSFAMNTNLEEILLTESSKLKQIGDCAFCSLPNLKFVDFWHCNGLKYIHENAFGAITSGFPPILKEFDIEDCNISVLPEKLINWKQIPKLSLNHNPFACNCSMAWLFSDLLSNNSIYAEKLFSLRDTWHHHKYHLGCLGPPPKTRNHTHSYTIVEIFESCKSSNSSSNILWHFITLFTFIGIFAIVLFYVRRSKIASNWYTEMT